MIIKDPIERKKTFVINTTLIIVFILMIVGSYWFAGVDFAKATLVGCLVVAINFFVSQRLIAKLIFEKSLQLNLLVAYIFKLTISALILFFAVTRFKVDPLGLMIGLSSILVATVISTIVGSPSKPENEES